MVKIRFRFCTHFNGCTCEFNLFDNSWSYLRDINKLCLPNCMNLSAKDSASVCHAANFEFPATPNTFLLLGTNKNNGHLKTDFFFLKCILRKCLLAKPLDMSADLPGVCRNPAPALLRNNRWRSPQVVMHPADMIFLSVQSEAPSRQIPYTCKTSMWTSMLEKSRRLSSSGTTIR